MAPNVATPVTSVVAALPEITTPGTFGDKVTATPERAAPELSITRTRTGGAIVVLTVVVVGCCRKNRFDPVGVTIGGSTTPAAASSLSTACDEIPGVTSFSSGLKTGSMLTSSPC